MPLTEAQFIDQMARAILDERVSLFLGAGGSVSANYPLWKDLVVPLARSLDASIANELEQGNAMYDYYKILQYYANRFGASQLRREVNTRVNRFEHKSPLMDTLLDLGFANTWTTNFDRVVELGLQERGVPCHTIVRDSDLSNHALDERRNVIKLNGDVSDLEGIVLTQHDYESYGDSHRLMLLFFKRELIANTMLFIGYSFSDHLVLDCLSDINACLGDSANYHYTIITRSTDPLFDYWVEDLESSYRIKALVVESHDEVVEVLRKVVTHVRQRRVFVSGAFRDGTDSKVEEFSHRISQSLAEGLLGNGYRIVNGIGRRFGTHLIGYASEYLAKHNVRNPYRHLEVTPFVGNKADATHKKEELRRETIRRCGTAVFVFGQADGKDGLIRSGVYQEYQLARESGAAVVPIRCPGMVSEAIWQEAEADLTRYWYLEKALKNLDSSKDADLIVNTVLHVMDVYKCATS